MTDKVIESECLTELLELMQIIDEYKEDIISLQSTLSTADENEDIDHPSAKLNGQAEKLEALKRKEKALKAVTCKI